MQYNTTINYSTKFLNPTAVIEEGLSEYNICSKNWPYPSGQSIGDVFDNYYAEIWTNGMDWQSTYWFIEVFGVDDPKAVPFLVFERNRDEELFNDYDFNNLLKFLLQKRKQFVTGIYYKIFSDEVVPYLHQIGNIPNKDNHNMILYHY